MKKLFLILCLLLTSVFAQEMDTTFVMDSRGELIPLVHEKGQLSSFSQVQSSTIEDDKAVDADALVIADKMTVDSITYYQGLVDKYKASGNHRVNSSLWMTPLGALGLVAGGWMVKNVDVGVGDRSFGWLLITGGFLVGGSALLIGGVSNGKTGTERQAMSEEYAERLRMFKERRRLTLPVLVDSVRQDVEEAYAEVLNDGYFKDYKKKAECRAKNSVVELYQCVEDAYSSGTKTFLALGGLSIGVGVLDFSYRYAKYGRDGEDAFRDVLDGAAIVAGLLSLAYGGIYWSMSDKYKEKLGKIRTEGSVADLRMAPYVDPVNGRYGGLLAMNF